MAKTEKIRKVTLKPKIALSNCKRPGPILSCQSLELMRESSIF